MGLVAEQVSLLLGLEAEQVSRLLGLVVERVSLLLGLEAEQVSRLLGLEAEVVSYVVSYLSFWTYRRKLYMFFPCWVLSSYNILICPFWEALYNSVI